MTVRNGKGWITLKRCRIVESAESAIECKARLAVQKQQKKKQEKGKRQ